jgi:hypothetical protein
MAHFFRIGPGEMQRQCFRRGQHISMSGKLQLRYKPPPERAAPLNSDIQLHRYPAQPLHSLRSRRRPFDGHRRRGYSCTDHFRASRFRRLRRRRSPQKAVEQGMRRRPITEPRRRHQSIDQILLSVAHCQPRNRTDRMLPDCRSTVQIADTPSRANAR